MSDTDPQPFPVNLELRESSPDGTEGEGLSHLTMKGLFLLHCDELAAAGEPLGGVCVIHDHGDHGGRYLALAQALAREGLAVSLPHFRGHGKSEGDRGHSWGVPEMVRDIESVAEHLAYMMDPDTPRFYVGQGLGAFYALCFALERPDRVQGLVLSGPLLRSRFEVPSKVGGLKGLFKKIGPTSAGQVTWSAEEWTGDAAERQAFESDELVHRAVTVRTAESLDAEFERVLSRLGEIQCPILVLHGADDTIAPTADSERISGANVERHVLPGVRHDVFHDAGAAEQVERVRDWLLGLVGTD